MRRVDQQLDRLADLLTSNATVVLSGSKIASELRIPHSTLGEWVERLRTMGVEVKGFPGSGYQLLKLPDLLTPYSVRQLLPGAHAADAFGNTIHHFYATGSTMDEAAKLARRGAPQGTLVVAEEQTAGRGRFGRRWISERAAGLYLTLLLRPRIAPAVAPALTLMTGVALAEAVQEITGLAADLRWPNDVMMSEKKCAGILVEMTAEPERIAYVLVGVGVNVNHRRMPQELAGEATSLTIEAGHRLSRLELLAAFLKRLAPYYNRLLESGPREVIARFAEISSYARGRHVQVTEGPSTLTGVTDGLTSEGFLLVRRADGRSEPVLSGQVRPAR